MGCWNGTCGITQLAIHSGEPTIGFLIVRNHPDGWAANGHCYSTQYWCPLSLHIEGIYNDYGTLEDVDEGDWNYQLALKYIKANLIEKDLGDNQYHDVPVKKDDLGWEKLADAIHEDRLELVTGGFWKQYYPHVTGLSVGLMMVHKKVFDAIIDGGIVGWRRDKITMETLTKDGWDIVEYFRKSHRLTASAITDSEKAIARMVARSNMDIVCSNDKDNNLKHITISGEGADFNTGKHYMQCLSDKVAEGASNSELEAIIKKMAEFYIFSCAMSMMRKTWMPQSGAGSQSDDMELYTTVNQTVDGIITERLSLYAAQDAEDE